MADPHSEPEAASSASGGVLSIMRFLVRSRIPRRPDLWPRAWRRRPIGLTLLILVTLAAVVARLHLSAGADHDRYHNRVFRCVHVVDGDTIDIDSPDRPHRTTRIRLWGVDTPETARSPQGEMYFGPEASAFTKSRVENVDVRIVLAPDQTRDKYGRLLAYVYFGDPPRMLNEEIVSQGYGYADTRFPHAWRERFKQLEERARKKRAGLWAGVTLEQMPPWRQRYETWKNSNTRPAVK